MRNLRARLLLVFLFLPLLLPADDFKPTTVILVRHAEKAADTDDPVLSAAGKARAGELARVLEGTGIQAVYTSQYIRTKDTAKPLAARLGLTPVEVNAGKPDLMIQDIFAHHAGQAVLVVGHSNTVPELISTLGAKVPPIGDLEYDNLYVVSVLARGKASVVRLKYGKESEKGAGQ